MDGDAQFQALCNIFTKAQKTLASHPSCIEAIEKIAKKAGASTKTSKVFLEDLLTLLRPVLASNGSNAIDRLATFMIRFAVATPFVVEDKGGKNPLSLWLIERLLQWNDVKGKQVRHRTTQLIGGIIKKLPEDVEIPYAPSISIKTLSICFLLPVNL